jgi:Subtilase family/PA domain
VYRTADNFPIYNQTHHTLVSVSKSHNHSVNACTSLPYNLTDAYVVTKRGGCSDYTKAANLQQAGAAAVILVSLPGQDTNIGLISVGIPVVSVPFDNGEQIQHLLRKRKRLSARLTTILSTLPVLSGGQVSSLSTLGPTNELELKPEISAVGGYVFSTLPRYLGSYGTMSGTSMSSPWVAGSIALLLGYNKDLNPQQVRTALMNYAQPGKVTFWNSSDTRNRQ